VILASKSPQRFLSLCLKIKQVSIYRLRHKIDGGRSAWDTCRDVATCFTWKEVGLGFPSLPSRPVEARRRVVRVASSQRLRRDEAEDGRVDTTGYIRPFYSKIIVFYILDPRGNLVFRLLIEPINKTLEGLDSFSLLLPSLCNSYIRISV
jgi:hypothetical protein